MNFKKWIKYVENFPAQGVLFRDLSPLWANHETLKMSTEMLFTLIKDLKINKVVAMESRGFIVASALATLMNVGLVLIRKSGKLAPPVFRVPYLTEYSKEGFVEIQCDALQSGDNILFVDDILATGQSALGSYELLQNFQGVHFQGFLFLLEIKKLQGREKLKPLASIFSLIED